ncbi:MAG: vWA domain-containing protein, partial [Gemmataceae bacterium]
EKVLQSANPGDGFTLVYLAGAPQLVVPGPSNDPEKVLSEIKALRPTHGTSDLSAGLSAIADVLARSPRGYLRRQVLFFTDLQKSIWRPTLPKPQEPGSDLWPRILARGEVAMIDVAGEDRGNLTIADFVLADPLPLIDSPTAVTATVQNFGISDRKQVRVELQLARPPGPGQDPAFFPIETRTIESVPAGGQASVTFALEGAARFKVPGLHALQVRLADADDLTIDDSRTLVADVHEGLSCLIVNGRAAADPLRRSSEYVAEALAPGGRMLPGNPARPKTVSLDEFADTSLSDLSAVDAVILCDVPTLTPAQIARLEGVLKRGGGVIFNLGPNAAANSDLYNRLLFAEGQGLFPGKMLGVQSPPTVDDPGYRLTTDDATYRRGPLAAFQDDNARAGLTAVPFRQFVKMEVPEGKARLVLQFTPAKPTAGIKMMPGLIEMTRHRGKVLVFTSTFHPEWNDWPRLPSFLPFLHELLRHATTRPDRHTADVGTTLEEFLPPSTVGTTATVTPPEGASFPSQVFAADDGALVRVPETLLSGIYRVQLSGQKPSLFAVNPSASRGSGAESDLRRIDPAELKALGNGVQVVREVGQIQLTSSDSGQLISTPRPHGPTIARWLIIVGLGLLVGEVLLAWQMGPGRQFLGKTSAPRTQEEAPRRLAIWLPRLMALVPLLLAIAVIFSILRAQTSGVLLDDWPESWRRSAEAAVGVPGAGPGEGTHWRLETATVFSSQVDRWAIPLVGIFAVILTLMAYYAEARAASSLRRLAWPFLLRLAAIGVAVFLILPQVRLAFDREGWPDVAILMDRSASMSTIDAITDPTLLAKTEELSKLAGVPAADRLLLAKTVLAHPQRQTLERLLSERQVKIHLYSIGPEATLLAEVDDPTGLPAAR